MKKQYGTKFITKILKADEKEKQAVEKEVNLFTEIRAGEKESNLISGTIDDILQFIKVEPESQIFDQEQCESICLEIRERVKHEESDSIEVNLDKKNQRYKGMKYELGDVLIKVLVMDIDTPYYLYLTEKDSIEAIVFLGGEEGQAFMAAKKEEGEVVYIRLAEFHLLSVNSNLKLEGEVGLMTSYSWLIGKVHSSVVYCDNLNPIKALFLSEGIRAKENKIKEELNVENEVQNGEQKITG